MTPRDRPWMLLVSLPRLAAFEAGAPLPIGRERLRSRLSLLAAQQLSLMDDAWRGLDRMDQAMIESDAALLREVASWLAHVQGGGRQWIVARLQACTLVAALQRRRNGLGAPPANWGFGPLAATLALRWQQPLFGLATAVPWLATAETSLNNDDMLGLMRMLDRAAWAEAVRLGDDSPFSFDALFGWCMQWRIAERWSSMSAPRSADRLQRWLSSTAKEIGALI